MGISNINVCVSSFSSYSPVMPRKVICLYQYFTVVYIIKFYVYNINFILKKFKILSTPICPLLKQTVISIFVVSIIFDSSFSVKVFD